MKTLYSDDKTTLSHVIAIVGSDGAGKSTLCQDLYHDLAQTQPVERVYLGQSSGAIGDWIQRLPIIGTLLGRYLKSKAKNVHEKKDQAPDILTALVIYLLSRWRVHKFKKIIRLNRKGIVVITDRYPQAEKPGFYFDGTGLGVTQSESFWVRLLERQERKLYQWMAQFRPALIIRLNVDAQTAHQRKPDHSLAMLTQKTTVLPTLTFNDANLIDLDGTAPYASVLKQAKAALQTTLSSQ